ncbi:MAG: Histidine kinase, partial [Thermodesulfobacteriota bacterium]|nr:Histidine kinase [Thermodesulfobacteriota bacterium]
MMGDTEKLVARLEAQMNELRQRLEEVERSSAPEPVSSDTESDRIRGLEASRARLREEIRERAVMTEEIMQLHSELDNLYREQTRELRRSEERYRSLVENSSEGIYRASWGGRFIEANNAMARILGYDSVEDLLENLTDLATQLYADPDSRKKLLELLLEHGRVSNYEALCHKKNGSILWISLNSRLVKDQQGTVQYIEGIFQDVTARKEAERKLADALEFTQNVLATSPQGILTYRSDGRFLTANDAAERIVSRMGTTSLRDNFRESDFWFASELARDAKEVLAQNITRQRQVRISGPNGKDYWLDCRLVSFQAGGESHLLLLVNDVTPQKVAEQALSEALSRLESVLQAATQVSIIATDTKGLITVFNKGSETMLGYSAEEIVGKETPAKIHLVSELKQHAEELSRELGKPISEFQGLSYRARKGGHEEREWTYLRRDGAPLTVHLAVTALKDDTGEITGFLGVAQDVTKRKQAEQELQKANSFQSLLLETAFTAIFSVSQEGTITDINEEFSRITGYSRQELVGKPCTTFAAQPCSQKCGLFNGLMNNDKVWRKQCTIRAKDGRLLTVLKNATVLRDDFGNITGGIESFVDVSELIEARIAAENA